MLKQQPKAFLHIIGRRQHPTLGLGSLQTHPEAFENIFALAPTDMNDPACSKIEHQGNVLAFLAEIHLNR